MLGWAGGELIFFIAASTGLCFGFVLETVLMFPSLHCMKEQVGDAWKIRGGTARPADPNWLKGYHMASCSAFKMRGRRRWWCLSSQVMCHGALLSCLQMGSDKLITCFYSFCLFIKLYLSLQVLHFYPSNSLPHCTRGGEGAAVWGLVANWG